METNEQNKLIEQGDWNQLFDFMVDSYQKPFYTVIRSIVGNHDDTNDVLQDSYLSIWKALPKFENKSSLFTWGYRICTNQALSFLRKHKRFVDQESALEVAGSTSQEVDGEVLLEKLKAFVVGLPDQQAKIFELKYFQNLKYRQIAEITGLTEGTLKKHYFLAVQKIKEFFNSGSTF